MLPFSFFLLLYRFRFSLSDFWSDFLSLSFLPSLIPSPVLLMQIMNSVPRPELGVKMVTWTCTNFKLKWMIRLIFFLPCIFYISHSHTHKKCVCPPTKKTDQPTWNWHVFRWFSPRNYLFLWWCFLLPFVFFIHLFSYHNWRSECIDFMFRIRKL